MTFITLCLLRTSVLTLLTLMRVAYAYFPKARVKFFAKALPTHYFSDRDTGLRYTVASPQTFPTGPAVGQTCESIGSTAEATIGVDQFF
jgi:hypothetical protein